MIDDIKDIFKNSGLEIPNEYLLDETPHWGEYGVGKKLNTTETNYKKQVDEFIKRIKEHPDRNATMETSLEVYNEFNDERTKEISTFHLIYGRADTVIYTNPQKTEFETKDGFGVKHMLSHMDDIKDFVSKFYDISQMDDYEILRYFFYLIPDVIENGKAEPSTNAYYKLLFEYENMLFVFGIQDTDKSKNKDEYMNDFTFLITAYKISTIKKGNH